MLPVASREYLLSVVAVSAHDHGINIKHSYVSLLCCVEENIPILTHCSPGGMTTHEVDFYQRRDYKLPSKDSLEKSRKSKPEWKLTYNPLESEGYFFDAYVHPKNWKPVLESFPELKLCLAHFGGDEWDGTRFFKVDGKGLDSDWIRTIVQLTKEYPNVYTDMSCFNLEDGGVRKNVTELFREMKHNPDLRHLQDKVIFGVDWYLSLVTRAPEYREYVESFFAVMDECDEWQWYRSALVNPATFYGLDKPEVIESMYKALKKNGADKERRLKGYKRVRTIPGQVKKIREELERHRTGVRI